MKGMCSNSKSNGENKQQSEQQKIFIPYKEKEDLLHCVIV